MKRLGLFRGYKYTTSVAIRVGDIQELRKLAKRENRGLRRSNSIDRLVVYPIPGMGSLGQLCVLR